MGKAYRSSQRRGDQMARANKTIDSNRSDDHLAREAALRKDSIEQTKSHTNKVRQKKGLPPQEVIDPGLPIPDDEVNNHILDESGDSELITDAGMIVTLRAYEDGKGTAVGGDDVVAIHRRVRRERARFRELNGEMVEVGQKLKRYDRTDKDEFRRVPGILKSTMVRLMPMEAHAVGAADMTRKDVDTAIDAVVEEFQRETGCEVLTAVAHRMSVTDLHLHIQYTMVQRFMESAHMLGRRLKPWKELASKEARAALRAEGILNPRPAQVGAKKKMMIAEGTLPPPPQAEPEYRKLPGKRDMGDGAILGYSFRQKLNLVRAAQQAGETELAKRVARRNDEKWGRFTPIANKPDNVLEAKYLDLWLERRWRHSVTSKLPPEIREKLIGDGVDAAKKYAVYGTSLVEQTHIDRRVRELDKRAEEIESRAEEVETAGKELAQIAATEIQRLQTSVADSEEKYRALQESTAKLGADRDRLARRAEELELAKGQADAAKVKAESALKDAQTELTGLKDLIRQFIKTLWEAAHKEKESLFKIISYTANKLKIDLPKQEGRAKPTVPPPDLPRM